MELHETRGKAKIRKGRGLLHTLPWCETGYYTNLAEDRSALVLHLRVVCGEYGRPLDDMRRAAVV